MAETRCRDAQPLADLLSRTLPALLRDQQALEILQRTEHAVDGAIVGTGKADFTQSNVAYRFDYDSKPFQLLDVPGIEGEEGKYEAMVHQAIAKAHLVFYVNGTNKKPEADTVRKIRRYLSRDGVVCAICNVRGHPDSYEFDEDRQDLDLTHGDAPATRQQTRDTLGAVLGPELLKDCLSVHGLLALSGLAYTVNGLSSVSPDRPDLRRTQAKYAEAFGTAEEMQRFSRIETVADLIRNSAKTFDKDIVDSNRRKVLRLIDDTIASFDESLREQAEFADGVARQVEAFETAVRDAGSQYAASIRRKCQARLNVYFNAIRDSTLDALEKNDADKDLVDAAVRRDQETEHENLKADLLKIEVAESEKFSELVEEARRRLEVDIKRVRFEQQLLAASASAVSLNEALETMDFGIGDFRRVLGSIVGWTVTGFGIGSGFPAIGNMIGAILGAVVGAVISAFKYFFLGKAAKIRDAQAKASRVIEEKREEVLLAMRKEMSDLDEKVQQVITDRVISVVGQEVAVMHEWRAILDTALKRLVEFRVQVETVGYGKY